MADLTDLALTDAQLHILKHSLGVADAKRAPATFYRSHFVTGGDSVDYPVCMELVALGLMQRRGAVPLYGGDDLFNVTGRGEAVVRASFGEAAHG